MLFWLAIIITVVGCKEDLRALRESRRVLQPVIQDLVEAEVNFFTIAQGQVGEQL